MKKLLTAALILGWGLLMLVGATNDPPPIVTVTPEALTMYSADYTEPYDSSTYYVDIYWYTGDGNSLWDDAGSNPTVWSWEFCFALDSVSMEGETANLTVWGVPLQILPPHTNYKRAWNAYKDTIECQDSIPMFSNLNWEDGIEQYDGDTVYTSYAQAPADTPSVNIFKHVTVLYCFPNVESLLGHLVALVPIGLNDGMRIYFRWENLIGERADQDTMIVYPWAQMQ